MEFIDGSFYHIYNRGNNKQPIFFQERNYAYFLQKVKQNLIPNANLLAWCLEIAWEYLDFSKERLLIDSYAVIPDEVVQRMEK